MAGKNKKKKNSIGPKVMFLMLLFFAASILFLPTTFVFFFGMMPSWALFISDDTQGKLRTLGIGVMNFSGVMYILLQLWADDHSLDYAVNLMLDPGNIIIMYTAAAVGYLVQSIVSQMTSGIVLSQTKDKFEKTQDKLQELETRWGYEVSGKIPLDAEGFPMAEEEKK